MYGIDREKNEKKYEIYGRHAEKKCIMKKSGIFEF